MLQLWQKSGGVNFTYSALAAALEQHGHKRAALKFCYTEASSNQQSKPQKCVETCGAPTVNSGNNPLRAIASKHLVKLRYNVYYSYNYLSRLSLHVYLMSDLLVLLLFSACLIVFNVLILLVMIC